MPTRRFYANTPPQRTLSTSLTSSGTSLTISGTFAGWPASFPYFAVLEIGTANAEIVSVTNVSGSVATIVRGQDGTVAVAHSGGATFDQVVVAKDLDEANAHTSANTGVHGVSGAVVGTSDAQTLTNKTLTTPTISSPNVTGTLAGASETLSGTLAVTGNTTVGGTLGVTGAVTTAAGVTVGTTLAVNGNTTMTGTLNGVSVADSGWQALTLTTGTGLARYRQVGALVDIEMNISSLSVTGGATVSLAAAGALPAAARPTNALWVTSGRWSGPASTVNPAGQFLIGTDGSIAADNRTGGSCNGISGRVSYFIG